MKRQCRNIYKKEKGFTLVELMIVIIIIAVLTGIAVPSYMTLNNRAKESTTKSEMKNIATALGLYQTENEDYPLTAGYPAGLASYMNLVPQDDAWSHLYTYISAAGSNYTLTSLGADGAAGGDDIVITNGSFTSSIPSVSTVIKLVPKKFLK